MKKSKIVKLSFSAIILYFLVGLAIWVLNANHVVYEAKYNCIGCKATDFSYTLVLKDTFQSVLFWPLPFFLKDNLPL